MTRIAYLGTGLLGSGFIEAAAKRGDSVTVWNRTAAKARALEQFGVTVAATPADAVRNATFVHLVLKDDAVVESVIAELRPGLAADTIIIDHTTTQPALTAARAARLNAEGVRYIHCPVFIGPSAARASKGTILASGPRALWTAIEAHLKPMAERVDYFGERPDLAAVYKLCGNAFIIGINSLVADVFAVAGGADVAADDALKILDIFNPASIIANRGKNMIVGDHTPGFELTMARKDVRLMMETAGTLPLAVLPAVATRMDQLIAAGDGDKDLSAMARGVVRAR